MSKAITTLAQAIARYHEVVGVDALQPNTQRCRVTANGIFMLRNVAGPLAVVTRHGAVLDRIGGSVLAAAVKGGKA